MCALHIWHSTCRCQPGPKWKLGSNVTLQDRPAVWVLIVPWGHFHGTAQAWILPKLSLRCSRNIIMAWSMTCSSFCHGHRFACMWWSPHHSPPVQRPPGECLQDLLCCPLSSEAARVCLGLHTPAEQAAWSLHGVQRLSSAMRGSQSRDSCMSTCSCRPACLAKWLLV